MIMQRSEGGEAFNVLRMYLEARAAFSERDVERLRATFLFKRLIVTMIVELPIDLALRGTMYLVRSE